MLSRLIARRPLASISVSLVNYRSLSRFQAAGIHFFASLIGTGLVALLTLLVWYPGELASLAGVVRILLMVIAIDVVLGPVITFIVFDVRKPELGRDLLIVAIVQIAALGYGAYTVFAGRPVYMVFNAERLDLVYAGDISKGSLERGEAVGFGRLPVLGPQLVAAVMPSDPAQAAKLVTEALRGGDDIQYRPEYFRPVDVQKSALQASLRPLDGLRTANPRAAAEVDGVIQRGAARPSGAGYLELVSSGESAVAVFDRSSAELLEIRRLNAGAKR